MKPVWRVRPPHVCMKAEQPNIGGMLKIESSRGHGGYCTTAVDYTPVPVLFDKLWLHVKSVVRKPTLEPRNGIYDLQCCIGSNFLNSAGL